MRSTDVSLQPCPGRSVAIHIAQKTVFSRANCARVVLLLTSQLCYQDHRHCRRSLAFHRLGSYMSVKRVTSSRDAGIQRPMCHWCSARLGFGRQHWVSSDKHCPRPRLIYTICAHARLRFASLASNSRRPTTVGSWSGHLNQ